MTCQEVTEFLIAYLEGGLDAPTRRAFDKHLSVCPACVNYLRSYETTVRMARTIASEQHAPKAVAPPEDLVQAILHARKTNE
ncbi:MAG: anti-sigma factor [Phycisphaerales bacterium]